MTECTHETLEQACYEWAICARDNDDVILAGDRKFLLAVHTHIDAWQEDHDAEVRNHNDTRAALLRWIERSEALEEQADVLAVVKQAMADYRASEAAAGFEVGAKHVTVVELIGFLVSRAAPDPPGEEGT